VGLLNIIKTKLTSDGVVDGSTWKCFIGYCPDDQDKVISLYSTGGLPQDTLGGENVIETIQVRVRAGALDYSACHDKWWEMFNSLQDADLTATWMNGIGIT